MKYIKLFLASLQFMSRIPVPERYTSGLDITDYRKGIITFPLVGLVVGVISAFVFVLTPNVVG
ncbi:cobalamin synthase [Budvicia aquatica]|uniref:Cobalamin synthase n=1 Tax=Budvicia aquatica TaxID=82979 RepID=A0A484ZME5_9GAMM|nr:cobalamin synthase [Budvicia aquatica]